jgi:hypothetical protein
MSVFSDRDAQSKLPAFNDFDIDRHNLALVSCFELLLDARLIEFLPTTIDRFFAVMSWANCHRFA